ncbi:MAG TPA: hypothetical protein VMJ75_15280 [Candidatus Acidoferrales bacterium]|nr:hypothetical protein [Candidatus Acidoferrales bacterium]HTS65263.1 hypothetical protein [Candidatus Acidoferrales bacterium]
MKRLFLMLAVTAGLLLGQARGPLAGVWQVVERSTSGPRAATNSNPQPGLFLFTEKHYSIVYDHSDTPRPDVDFSTASDAEKLAVLMPMQAQSGTYEISGATVTLHPVVVMITRYLHSGYSPKFTFQVEGKTLVMTQIQSPNGPVANPVTTKLTRVE